MNIPVPPAEGYSDRWEKRWKDDGGVEPGTFWDAKAASPALVDLLESGRLPVAGKRTFVPGCGRGYDLVALSRAGAAEAVGLELSPTATEIANEYVASQLPAGAPAKVVQGDFFDWSDARGDGSFDVGYDYTFFCAVHPDARAGWAAAWRRHLAPGGTLVTLIFPPPGHERTLNGGPPFEVTPDLYRATLGAEGFEEIDVSPVPDALSHKGRAGEFLGLWRRV